MRANIEKEAAKLDQGAAFPATLRRHQAGTARRRWRNWWMGQCGGCFMSLPSATLRELKLGEKTVECDNCGRILYDPK